MNLLVDGCGISPAYTTLKFHVERVSAAGAKTHVAIKYLGSAGRCKSFGIFAVN